MKDIDFDELDRAVSSLMKTVPQASSPAPAVDATEVVPVTTSQIVPASPLAEPENIPAVPDVTPLYAKEPLQEKPRVLSPAVRRGRFMDVVRTNESASRKPFPTGSVSRQGPTLQPTGTPRGTNREESPALAESGEEIIVVENVAQARESWQEAAGAPNQEFAQPSYVEDMRGAAGDTDANPLSSPFLPGAKVEKRPLGRAQEAGQSDEFSQMPAADTTDSEAESFPKDTFSPDKDAQLPEQPLPAELGSELLSIETGADTVPLQSSSPAETESERTTPLYKAEPASPLSPSTARAMAATSINQQYKVKPRVDDDEPAGAIYDTQPLVHPAKKQPGWLWVAAIVAISLLGAGCGAAIYYLGIL